MRVTFYIIAAFLLGAAINASAQEGRENRIPLDRSTYYGPGPKLYADVAVMPGVTKDSARVMLIFKVLEKSMYFTQINSGPNYGKFMGMPQLEVVFRDTLGIIRNRIYWQDTVLEEKFETTNENSYIYGFAETVVEKGKYTVGFELLGQYGKTEDHREIKVDAFSAGTGRESFSSPVCFADRPDGSNPDGINMLEPWSLNGGIGFAPCGSFILIPFSSDAKNFRYQLKKVNSELREDKWYLDADLKGECEVLDGADLKPASMDSKAGVRLKLLYPGSGAQAGETSVRTGFLKIKILPKWIAPGKYDLSILRDGRKDTVKFSLPCIWLEEPRSFKTVKYASESLSFIVPEEQLGKISSGKDNEIYRKVIEFWKGQDPTPETVYNEALNEYYKRVDYAYINYQTIKERDGTKTDRGMIYILYGQPDSVDTFLRNGRSVETWTYNKLTKEFTFEAISPGNYKLLSIKK